MRGCNLLGAWRPRSCVALLAVALAASPLPTQDRAPAFGRVLDRNGRPAQVDVTLVSQARFGLAERPPDIVTATTDVHGRFVVRLLVGEGYSAWATRRGAGRKFIASPVRDHVAAGAFVELQLAFDREQLPVVVTGEHKGPFAGELRVQLVLAAANEAAFDLDDGGLSPRLPFCRAALLSGPDGTPLCSVPVANDGTAWRIALPPVQDLWLRLSRIDGKAVTGARAFARVRLAPPSGTAPALFQRPVIESVREVQVAEPGTADLRCAVPAPATWGSMLFVCADDCEPHHVVLPQTASGRLDVALRPAVRLRVQPVAQGRLLLAGCWLDARAARSSQLVPDELGWCPLPLSCEPLDGLLAARCGNGREPGLARLSWACSIEVPIQLGQLRRVEFQVLDPGLGPAAGVPGALIPHECRFPAFFGQPVFADQAGRGVHWLGEGDWTLVFCDGRNLGTAVVARGAVAGPLTVRLQPLPVARVRLVGGAGRPLPGRSGLAAMRHDQPQIAGRIAALATIHACERVSSDRNGLLELPFAPEVAAQLQLRVPPSMTEIPWRPSTGPADVTEIRVAGR